jgi:NCAIR mutase (PurE)-related protein
MKEDDMDPRTLAALLAAVAAGEVDVDEAARRLEDLPFSEVSADGDPVARVDHHRELRTGYPEVVFCQGKTPQQVKAIARDILEHGDVMLGTRANAAHYQAVAQVAMDARFFEDPQIILVDRRSEKPSLGHVVVASAGTADHRVAEEAAVCAEVMGDRVTRLFDVGVAGIHRLLAVRHELAEANVVIAVAGMEGALPSLVAGLVKVPVIAVPTSVGYGTHFGGVAPLLTMLNSCAPGIGVVNIDNGYGAAALASRINRAAVGGSAGAGSPEERLRAPGETDGLDRSASLAPGEDSAPSEPAPGA